jgi:hypothetical protein
LNNGASFSKNLFAEGDVLVASVTFNGGGTPASVTRLDVSVRRNT